MEGEEWNGQCSNLQVPAGTAMLISVSTSALPRAGTTVALEA